MVESALDVDLDAARRASRSGNGNRATAVGRAALCRSPGSPTEQTERRRALAADIELQHNSSCCCVPEDYGFN
jgi:hypothetical protein